MRSSDVRIAVVGVLAGCVITGTVIIFFALNADGPRGPIAHVPDGRLYDFGEIQEGDSIRHVFSIQNTGTEALKILRVATGCGCTSARTNKTEVKPGGNAEIEVTYTGRRIKDRESVSALVETNDLTNPFLEFIIAGFVRYKVFWYPESVSFFGQSGSVFEPKQVVFMAPKRPQGTFALEVVSVSSDVISAQWIEHKQGVALRITVSPDCPRGARSESIVVRQTGDKSTKPIHIPVYIKVL